jgi:hypothetical protein
MSYATMDHADWVEHHNAAQNRQRARRKSYSPAPEKLTPFQARAVDILGIVFGGVYNAPIAWESVDWRHGGNGVSVLLTYGRELATYDFNQLTMFVFLCHEGRIRGSIQPGGFRSLRISMWPRRAEGGVARRHPTIEEALVTFREYVPADHRIFVTETMAERPSPDGEGSGDVLDHMPCPSCRYVGGLHHIRCSATGLPGAAPEDGLVAKCGDGKHVAWEHMGGVNCGCDGGACSVPVYGCKACGDSDYGQNDEATRKRNHCAELSGDGARRASPAEGRGT